MGTAAVSTLTRRSTAAPGGRAVTGRSDVEARQQAGLAVAGLAAVTFAAARLGVRCPIRAVFGIDCPGCGGTRALLALMVGDVPQAARENAAALVAGLATAGYVIAPARVGQAAAVVRASAERHRATRWWARHPKASACAAAGLWCLARNLRRPSRPDRGAVVAFLGDDLAVLAVRALPERQSVSFIFPCSRQASREVPEAAPGSLRIRPEGLQRGEDLARVHPGNQARRILSFYDRLSRHLAGGGPLQRGGPDVIVGL
jgi:hypothetical protein